MFHIDDKELKLIKQEIYVGKFTNNGDKGYNINIKLEFVNKNNIKGYLHLDAGFEKNNNINVFINKEYNGIPFANDNQFICFEMFDTEKFLDTEIESKIIIKLKYIKEDQVKVFFELNDELIKIKFGGYLNIVNII